MFELKPIWLNDEIQGFRIFEKFSKEFFFLINQDKLDFEFKDKNFKTTIKKIIYRSEEIVCSINRFRKELSKKLMNNDFSFEDQCLLSDMRHEWIMNTVPGPRSIGEWLFKAEPSILKPRLSL